MRNSILKLFGKSPFEALQTHMQQVAECVALVPSVLKAYKAQDPELVAKLAAQMSEIEHTADILKLEVRNNVGSSILLPISKADILDIVTLQDAIAGKAEDVGFLLTLRQAPVPEDFAEPFAHFVERNMICFRSVKSITAEFSELLESSFGGSEAKKVRDRIDKVALDEHEIDKLHNQLLQKLFAQADSIPHWAFYIWNHVLGEVARISRLSEKLAFRIRTILELK